MKVSKHPCSSQSLVICITDDLLLEPVPKKAALQAKGVSVGPRTSRHRLLELCNKYISEKKPRLCSPVPRTIRPQSSRPVSTRESKLQSSPIDFEAFGEGELVEMLRSVGVMGDGMDKTHLISACHFYEDLSKSDYCLTFERSKVSIC